ncbi:hypothetical protein CLU79DRAFT_742400 [Phycomyces nitens]|nr:hypothetical protein CLU79DRAFT_742400 [Phycomyces nitens]
MSFATFPSYLPFFASLHDSVLLSKEIDNLSGGKGKEVKELAINDSQPFMDALLATRHSVRGRRNKRQVNSTRTTNGALAHVSSLDSRLDLYYQLGGQNWEVKTMFDLLEKSWIQDPLRTLQIIFCARSIHRGNSAKDRFYLAFGWLISKHPQTALANLPGLTSGTVFVPKIPKKDVAAEKDGWDIVEENPEEKKKKPLRGQYKSHGYWKDLSNLLTIYATGEIDGPVLSGKYKALYQVRPEFDYRKFKTRRDNLKAIWKSYRTMSPEEAKISRAKRAKEVEESQKAAVEKARQERRQARKARQERIIGYLETDAKYRALHFSVARQFADQLKKDYDTLQSFKDKTKRYKYAISDRLSLAAKWAPTLQRSHDKNTLLATSISELLFPPEAYQIEGETREHYLNKVREMYRKQYLGPLREALDVTERKMQDTKWNTIDFTHVPSVCMQNNSGKFFKHTPEEFTDYIVQVALGKKSISGATLAPHELAKRGYSINNNSMFSNEKSSFLKGITDPDMLKKAKEVETSMVNSQWETLVKSIREVAGDGNSNLGSSIGICDLSGSMYAPYHNGVIPIWPSVSLSLILATLSAPPFNGAVITFSEVPTVVKIDHSKTFIEQVSDLMDAPMGYSTNFEAIFVDLLLPMAKENNIAQKDMVKRLFVFSDMEFNETEDEDKFNTMYEGIEKKYKEAGYEVPELIWWNLGGTKEIAASVSEEESATSDSEEEEEEAPAGNEEESAPTDLALEQGVVDWTVESPATDWDHEALPSWDTLTSNVNNTPLPVTKDVKGCTMVCGFSASILKNFIDGEGVGEGDAGEETGETKEKKEKETPVEAMLKHLNHKSFSKLVVVD